MSRVITTPPEDSSAANGVRAAGWWRDADDGQRLLCELCPRGCLLQDWPARLLLRPREPRRADGLDHLRPQHRLLHRPDRKEAAEPFLSRHVGALVRHGRLQPGLQVLPELGHLEVARYRAACEIGRARGHRRGRRASCGCRSVAFTYNDPIVWAEYAIDTARPAAELGIKTVAVTSGYISPAAREAFYEFIDAANVDLKGFSDEFYRQLTAGHLAPVLDTLRWLVHESSVWLEITNLVIPAGERFARTRSSGCAAGLSRNWGPTCRCTSRRFIPISSDAIAGRRRRRRLPRPTRSPPRRACTTSTPATSSDAAPDHLLPRLRPGRDRARWLHSGRLSRPRGPLHELRYADRRPAGR